MRRILHRPVSNGDDAGDPVLRAKDLMAMQSRYERDLIDFLELTMWARENHRKGIGGITANELATIESDATSCLVAIVEIPDVCEDLMTLGVIRPHEEQRMAVRCDEPRP